VFHADVSNSFSSVVKKGVEQAGDDLNVKVEVRRARQVRRGRRRAT